MRERGIDNLYLSLQVHSNILLLGANALLLLFIIDFKIFDLLGQIRPLPTFVLKIKYIFIQQLRYDRGYIYNIIVNSLNIVTIGTNTESLVHLQFTHVE